MTTRRRSIAAMVPSLMAAHEAAAQSSDRPVSGSAPAPAGLANPAAAFCIQAGARPGTRREAGGERSICILPDGREVDAWEFYRQRQSGQDGRLPGAATVPAR